MTLIIITLIISSIATMCLLVIIFWYLTGEEEWCRDAVPLVLTMMVPVLNLVVLFISIMCAMSALIGDLGTYIRTKSIEKREKNAQKKS